MKPIYPIIFAIFSATAFGIYFFRSDTLSFIRQQNCQSAKCNIPKVLKQFKLTETYEDKPDRFRGLYVNDNNKVRIDIQAKVSRFQAKEIAQQGLMALNALFEDRTSAYPGQISKEITCNEKYKPVIEKMTKNNAEIILSRGLFTSRFTMGACVDDLLPYKGFIAWYWCPKTNILNQVEVISPKENDKTDEVLSSLSCSN